MTIELTDEAKAVDDDLYGDHSTTYDKIWDVLEKIDADPTEAQHAPWTNFVSTQDLYGTKVPGTTYTVFWRVSGDVLDVRLIVEDLGL